MAVPKFHIVIVGAGIGGLAAAIALRKAGCTIEIHERTEGLRPVGAGITIQPNALLALRHLGIGDAVERAGQILGPGSLSLADGTLLSQLSAAQMRDLLAEVGAPAIGIHRATLHEVLLGCVGREVVHLGRTATRYEAAQRGIRVHFGDGSVVHADALVGADGIHSICRKQLLGEGAPTYSGYFCWRGVAPRSGFFANNWGGEIWAAGLRFGGCCIDGDRFYWFAVANGPALQSDLPGLSKNAVLDTFKEFPQAVLELIATTPEQAIFRSDIADRQPVTTWGEGRMTLLGDAAHAMTPNLGQGACQAIEDALVLGKEVAAAKEIPSALRSYEKLRQPRVNKVVTMARRLGAVGQWHNPVAVFFRSGLFRMIPSSLLRRQLAAAWKLPYSGY